MSKSLSAEFCAWIDGLDRDYELTLDHLILMQEAWNAALELERSQRIDENGEWDREYLVMKDTTPTKGQLRDALDKILKHLGEMPHDWPSQDLFRAYCAAEELLRPDEFNRRFRERANIAPAQNSSQEGK